MNKIPIFLGIFFLSNFFYGILPENFVLFGIFGSFKVLDEFWRQPEDPRIRGVIESIPWGNRDVKKVRDLKEWETRNLSRHP